MSSLLKKHLKPGNQYTNMRAQTFNLNPLCLPCVCGHPEDKEFSGNWDWKDANSKPPTPGLKI